MSNDVHVLMVAFGGPETGCCKVFDPCPGEAYCFVSGIFGHNASRKQRIEEVTAHYRALGGYSRFNDYTRAQASALESELRRRGHSAAVSVGFHHWAPYVRDVIADLADRGTPELTVAIMAPHQSTVSWDHYLRIVGEGVQLAGEGAPRVAAVVDPWWNKEGFISAIAARIRQAAGAAGVDLKAATTGLLFTAHSIPQAVARGSKYCSQFEETARIAAAAVGGTEYRIAYQSQPGDSSIPWTGPAIAQALEELKSQGKTTVIASAVGFLCDNVEVLHDLGVEGAHAAEKVALRFVRAESVHDHPAFISMLADGVEAKMAQTVAK